MDITCFPPTPRTLFGRPGMTVQFTSDVIPLLCGVDTALRYYVIRDVIVLQILCFHRPYRPYSRCQSLKPSLVFLNGASYGRRRNNDVTSQEREVTMMLRHNLRTDAQICGKSATQASLFVRHGRGVNRVYSRCQSLKSSLVFLNSAS